MSKQTDFNAAYIASKPPAVRALFAYASDEERIRQGQLLATQGYILCDYIDIRNHDPYLTMQQWEYDGYTWRPNANQQNLSVAPGLNDQHDAPYDPLNPPAGSIKVSTNPADFPPFDPPKPTPPAPLLTKSPVAQLLHDNLYASQSWDHYPVLSVTGSNGIPADPRGSFTKVALPSIFYQAYVWALPPQAAGSITWDQLGNVTVGASVAASATGASGLSGAR